MRFEFENRVCEKDSEVYPGLFFMLPEYEFAGIHLITEIDEVTGNVKHMSISSHQFGNLKISELEKGIEDGSFVVCDVFGNTKVDQYQSTYKITGLSYTEAKYIANTYGNFNQLDSLK